MLGEPDLGVDGPSQEAMDWQAATEDLVPQLQAIAGERLGGLWLQWVPERAVVVRLVTRLEEGADEVRLEVTSTTPGPGRSGDGCLDGLDVTLQAPLGDRALVDLSRGVVVEVS